MHHNTSEEFEEEVEEEEFTNNDEDDEGDDEDCDDDGDDNDDDHLRKKSKKEGGDLAIKELHDDILKALLTQYMNAPTEANLYREATALVPSDATMVAKQLSQIDQQIGKNKMRLYVLKGRCIQNFIDAGGKPGQLKKLMGSEKRNLSYFKAAFVFCKAYPLMLFCCEWRSIRDKFKALTAYIVENETSLQWQLSKSNSCWQIAFFSKERRVFHLFSRIVEGVQVQPRWSPWVISATIITITTTRLDISKINLVSLEYCRIHTVWQDTVVLKLCGTSLRLSP